MALLPLTFYYSIENSPTEYTEFTETPQNEIVTTKGSRYSWKF